MNEFVLFKIKEAILLEPEHFHMGSWECETTACIGGWAMRLAGIKTPKTSEGVAKYPYFSQAAKVLKLSHEQADRLFYWENWPEEFRMRTYSYESGAQQAADRIDHFVATEGRE